MSINLSKQKNTTNDNSSIVLDETPGKSLSSLMEMNDNESKSINYSPEETSFKKSKTSFNPLSYISFSQSNNLTTYIQYGIIVIIISLLGLNVFGVIGNITEQVTEIIRPLASYFGYNLGETIKTTVTTSASGTKGIIDASTGTIVGGVDVLEKGLNYKNRQNRNKMDNSFLDQSVPNITKPEEIPEPDESGSRTQKKFNKKSGYCYIGEDRGFRNCIEVGENDVCMSGDIFPSQEICINPNLRE